MHRSCYSLKNIFNYLIISILKLQFFKFCNRLKNNIDNKNLNFIPIDASTKY
jgi:hypothetical protein